MNRTSFIKIFSLPLEHEALISPNRTVPPTAAITDLNGGEFAVRGISISAINPRSSGRLRWFIHLANSLLRVFRCCEGSFSSLEKIGGFRIEGEKIVIYLDAIGSFRVE
ncbi:MAG: hypothetical protein V1862_07125 [Methanobacteriota archaeon]